MTTAYNSSDSGNIQAGDRQFKARGNVGTVRVGLQELEDLTRINSLGHCYWPCPMAMAMANGHGLWP